MTVAIYPGSFDPVTNGHLDIVERCLAIHDRVIVAVADNTRKASALFTLEERMQHLRESINSPRVEVDVFRGLLVDYVRSKGARVVVRGLRAIADFEYEFQLAHMNRRLAPEVETVFLMTGERDFFVSSSLVKEVASLGGDLKSLVPPNVARALERKMGR